MIKTEKSIRRIGTYFLVVVLTTLALLYFDAMLIILSQAFDQQDISGYIALVIITAIVLLNCCLCFKLYKLLFKAQ